MNGVVQYSKVGRLHVGSPYTFEVTVMGAHAVGSISPSPNRTINPGPVSIGGSTGVKLSWNGTDCTAQSPDCTPQSSERRNIVTASDRAEWTWTLTPHQTGTARVSLFITTYEQDTNNDLWESPPIEQDIQVTATPSYLINRAASWVKALITLIGASTIGGLVMVLWRRIHKPKAEGGKAATPEETSPSEPSTKTGEKAPVDPWQPPS